MSSLQGYQNMFIHALHYKHFCCLVPYL